MYKRLKYEQGYKDRAQGKAPRYPVEVNVFREDQSVSGSLPSDAPLPTTASGSTTKAPLAKPSFGVAGMSFQDSVSG